MGVFIDGINQALIGWIGAMRVLIGTLMFRRSSAQVLQIWRINAEED
jgi:hypothetical protein